MLAVCPGLERAIKANLSILATFPLAAGGPLFKATPVTCRNVNRDGLVARIQLGKVATVDTFTFLRGSPARAGRLAWGT